LVHRQVQKVFSRQSSSLVLEQRNRDFNLARCSRCLSSSHSRTFCKNAIKCFVCLGWGYVAANCLRNSNPDGNVPMDIDPKGKDIEMAQSATAAQHSSWFRSARPIGPSSSRSPVFQSFSELAISLAGNANQPLPVPKRPIIVNWSAPSPSNKEPPSCELSLGGAFSPSAVANIYSTTIVDQPLRQESPSAPTNPPLQTYHPDTVSEVSVEMAYQRADPAPFVPNGMHRLNVPGRVAMVRAVARSRPSVATRQSPSSPSTHFLVLHSTSLMSERS
jgi:hypothetical protein